ncbi:MAG: lysine--tRNA ligase [Thiomargarita sp.]|nr:lysine--tRNA ligase [Thiomargarita sp.]
MPKVNWPHQEAKRLQKIISNSDKPIIFETGYGPSGLPHIGTFAEVARTTFVMQALKHISPNTKVRLIAFSDDMDGLRSLPENVPNHDQLRPFLGKPLSSIPDPFGKSVSFAHYMNEQLQHFLDSFGFEYEFFSSTQCYQNGTFDQGLKKIMDNYNKIRTLFIATISKEKRENWSPFFPICESCGKIYTTRILNVNNDDYTVTYCCDQANDNLVPCGHKNTISILGGRVKTGWKIDWALRWATFGVNYEMYGKDLISSANMASKICTILGAKPPTLYKYELFLDENGAKISKKIGNGISMQQWIKYSPLGGLLNFLLANPNKAKQMGMPLLPKIVDDYIKVLGTEGLDNVNFSRWFVDSVQHRHDATGLENNELSYSLLVNVAQNMGLHDSQLLYQYAKKYDSNVGQNENFFRLLCEKVINYLQDYELKKEIAEVVIDSEYLPYLPELVSIIQNSDQFDTLSGEEIQALLFLIPKKHDLNQPKWFKLLYSILLRKEKGPRLGPFLSMLGKEKVLSMLKTAVV